MQKINGETLDIINVNKKKLKEIFPDIFNEGKIDFEALKSNLGEFIEKENERYSFTWNGKEMAKKIALTPSTGTLRPCKKESKDWENTENLYIEGDNLEVLKLLQKSYFEKIKMIYIDPPYNTGKDFVYKDNFKENIQNYLEITGQVDKEGQKKSTNSDISGRYHSNWLNMMYPRLKLARNLLAEDGVIFISIDDNEQSNLKKLCDEIFGEENFIGEFIWKKTSNPNTNKSNLGIQHEYICCYGKKEIHLNLLDLDGNDISEYKFKDEFYKERGYYKLVGLNKTGTVTDRRPNLEYVILGPNGESIYPNPRWRWSKDKFELGVKEGRIVFKNLGEKTTVYYKQYLLEDNEGNKVERGKMILSILDKFGRTTDGTLLLNSILGKGIFDFTKPKELIQVLIKLGTKLDDIILDFFSGSATTAHAVMQLNSEDGGNRKHIMVQLPETTDENSEAYKAGYKNICEIGKERIRRAGEKIKDESIKTNPEKEFKTDIGFKVFKLDTSNIKTWDSEYAKDDIQTSLLNHIDNIKEDRTENDLLFELLLKQGLDLTTPIMEVKVTDKTIYNIGAGALYISLSTDIGVEVAEKIIEENKIYNSPKVTVIFKDNGFITDVEKTNVIQTLKVAGITEIKSI